MIRIASFHSLARSLARSPGHPFRRPLATLLAAFFLASVAGAPPAYAKKKKSEDAASAAADKKDDESPFKEWDKTLKEVETSKGLFTVHRKYDSIWLELTPGQLDKPYLMVSSLTSGLGKGYLLGGMPLDTDLWMFHRAGNRIQVKVRNARFLAAAGTPMNDAVGLSYADSILASPKIISIHKDTKNLLVDMSEIFMNDLPGIGLALKGFLGAPAGFDKERSSVAKLKVFPKNMELEVAASFTASDPKYLDTVSDARYLPVGLHYSVSELPDDGFKPRTADDRVGYFLTAVKDFSRDSEDTFFLRYVNRWDLQKKDPLAAVSEPKQPIVFYLDRTIPMEYRDVVRHGIEMWNKAFEAAGFRNAIIAKDPPADDPDFDPEDARYNTIRWITSSEPSFGAIGPSRVDPRNGHILDADILVEAAMVQNTRRGYRNYVATRQMRAAAGLATAPEGSRADIDAFRAWLDGQGGAICNLGEGMALQTAVDGAAFAALGEIPPGGEVPEAYVQEFFGWVIAHEVGHTLGLRHNFRASVATPYDKLNDKSWTEKNGLYDSVMEYPVPNFSLDRAKQGNYYTRTVGTYDVWAIRYGYTEYGSPDAEKQGLATIGAESSQPGHEYGTDEDAFPGPVPLGVDPAVNHFDLGSDPLSYARDRLALISDIRGKMDDTVIAPGESWDRLRNSYESLLIAQGQALSIVSKQIGGMNTTRAHRDEPGGRAPIEPVPAARQREAMGLLVSNGFADSAWATSPDLINHLQPDRWAHWGSAFYADGQVDYPWTDKVGSVQTAILDRILHPLTLARLSEIEARSPKGQAYTLGEHLKTLNDGVFSDLDGKGALNMSVTRRNLGRALIEREIALVNHPDGGTPEDARSLARMNLAAVEKRMGTALGTRGAGMDDATKAYLEEARLRIKRALDAPFILVGGAA